MSGLFDKSLLENLENEADEKLEEKENKKDLSKINELLEIANGACFVEDFEKAKKIYKEILDIDYKNIDGYIGLIRVESEDYTKFEGEGIEKNLRILNKIDEKYSYLKNKDFATYLKNRKEFLKGQNQNIAPKKETKKEEFYSLDKVKELVASYDYKEALPSIEHYAENCVGPMVKLLASFYLKGIIVNKNESKALELYEKAYDLGEKDSAKEVLEYLDNKGTSKTSSLYKIWLQKTGKVTKVEEPKKDNSYSKKETSTKESEDSIFSLDEVKNFLDKISLHKDEQTEEINEKVLKTLNYYANLNDIYCINNLASAYNLGYFGLIVDYKKSFELFNKLIMLNSYDAYNDIARFYENGNYVEKNPNKAIEYYTKAYDLKCDNSFTCYNIASIYLNDFDKPNYAKALEWYKKSTERNRDWYACSQLGKFYEEGLGTNQDLNEALKWYQKGLDDGDKKERENVYRLKKLLAKTNQSKQNITKDDSIYSLKELKNFLSTIICFKDKQTDEVNKKVLAALNYYADLDDIYCIDELADAYCYGYFKLRKDDKKSFELNQKLIKLVYYKAYDKIARFYEFGWYVEKDLYKAIEYYTKAYDLKCDGLFTCKEIANIYLNDFEMPNYSKALEWYKKSAERNNDWYSFSQLGKFYEEGLGVKKDLKEALKWYQKGFDDGDKKEQENIDRVKKLLNK